MRTTVTAALQRQYLQMELLLWIRLVDNIKKNTQTLIDASKEVGLEINTEKTKYMLLSRHQNSRKNHDII
jgi:hypothetical protein